MASKWLIPQGLSFFVCLFLSFERGMLNSIISKVPSKSKIVVRVFIKHRVRFIYERWSFCNSFHLDFFREIKEEINTFESISVPLAESSFQVPWAFLFVNEKMAPVTFPKYLSQTGLLLFLLLLLFPRQKSCGLPGL